MRVLAANKFYYVKGGAERYFFELKRILEERGDEVVPFAMRDERNEPSPYSDYFVSHEDFEGGGSFFDRMRAAERVVYSLEARRRLEALIDETRPDMAHLHNIAHQLSPSIIDGLGSRAVPVVQTLHDYKLVCPGYQMMVEGENCERCRGGRYYEVVRNRCMRGSTARSLVVCAEAYLHRLLGTYSRGVRLFIAPSRSLRERMIAHGVAADRIVHLPYAIALSDYAPDYSTEGYAVYVGRLSTGKGLGTLLKAAARATDVRIKVVGTGPLEPELRGEVRRLGLDNVEFMGYRTGGELKELFSKALCVVVPSECYENSPLTIYEAMALGKAVLGSTMGGIPELIEEGSTGVVFQAGDPLDLAERLAELSRDPEGAVEMGREGRRKIERDYSPARHYESLMGIYERARA